MIARVERGERLLSLPDARRWLRASHAGPEARSRVLALTEGAHTETRTWRDLLSGTDSRQDEFQRRDVGTSVLQSFDAMLLPGHAQTPDYARATLPLVDPDGVLDHTAHLAGRVTGQRILREPGHRFEFVVAERLLYWEPEPGVLFPQLAQLRAVAGLESVRLAILPEAYVGPIPFHNFALRYPADGVAPSVDIELVHGEQTVTDAHDVATYERLWKRLWDGSRTGDDALESIDTASRRSEA